MSTCQPRSASSALLAALLALYISGCEQPDPRVRLNAVSQDIIGGTTTPADQAGYMAALVEDYGHGLTSLSCGGAFVGPDVVVTAAHCSFDLGDSGDLTNQAIYEPIDPSRVKVVRRPAVLSKLDASALLPVESIHVHPEFAYTVAVVNDIAVWRLASASQGPTLRLAPTWLLRQLERDDLDVRAYGYGLTSLEPEVAADVLTQVD